MRILEVKKWKKVAFGRDEWAKLLKKKGQGPPRAVEPKMIMILMMITVVMVIMVMVMMMLISMQ
jgi:hypothetical protein